MILHADRGREYGRFACVNRLQDAGIQISMSVPGQPTQNTRAESFLKTVKEEEVDVHHSQTFEEAQAHVQSFLEDVSNAKRLHSSMDDVSPDEFEAEYLKCASRGGMDFLGALQLFGCQLDCQKRVSLVTSSVEHRYEAG